MAAHQRKVHASHPSDESQRKTSRLLPDRPVRRQQDHAGSNPLLPEITSPGRWPSFLA
jgi:hypothetical protein